MLIAPAGYQLPVSHVGLFHVFPKFNAGNLRHYAIPVIAVVLRFSRIKIWHITHLYHFGIHDKVKRKKVGPAFLDGRAVLLKLIAGHTGGQLPASMA